MLNFVYRFCNGLVAGVFATTAVWAVYEHAPAFWNSFNEAFVGSFAILAVAGSVTVGFCLLDARKI